ncbi:TetR/AcrR family transcriptional regulator [Cupriavidus necator]|uniref:TetR/AcrR family transcriptional regulator n=1 Tax=Cupriavidus necator TaxID=106590 RepID=UPI0005B2F0B8|nr:TetR/AcrR family transcriptional regulator [Cupriavidus necator]
MARPLSPEKRNALLQSATRAIAEHGVQATTASIARAAGVAEGTLFTYFENKEALFQELYLNLKQSLAEAIMPDYPHEAGYRQRMAHIFQCYVGWGLDNAEQHASLGRLSASGLVLDETRIKGMAEFLPISRMMEMAVRENVVVGAPIELLTSVIESLADTTIDYVNKYPEGADRHRELGFHLLWKALSV